MRTARARTSVEKRFPGFPFSIAYLPSFWLSGKPGMVQYSVRGSISAQPAMVKTAIKPKAWEFVIKIHAAAPFPFPRAEREGYAGVSPQVCDTSNNLTGLSRIGIPV